MRKQASSEKTFEEGGAGSRWIMLDRFPVVCTNPGTVEPKDCDSCRFRAPCGLHSRTLKIHFDPILYATDETFWACLSGFPHRTHNRVFSFLRGSFYRLGPVIRMAHEICEQSVAETSDEMQGTSSPAVQVFDRTKDTSSTAVPLDDEC